MSTTSQESNVSNETFGKDATFKLSQLIGSMSISPSSRDVVLGSKEGLRIIDLDSPYEPPRFLPHRTPWEVADVQWSPFADRDYWIVSTSNQKALVWNLNLYGWRNSIQHVLHGHTRAITDINFSAHHPDKLATCAVDSFVHCWDLRCPDRPVNSFSDWFAGATQVKWSRQDEHVIASSHDKFLHIWDDRKGAYPARTIEAHDTKIYGIDWNRFDPSKIVTCSLDKTIKFWDTNNPDDIPDRVIETNFPVWRARHTPFGWGLMVMPQRGNGDLHLYDRRAVHGVLESGRVKPVHIFPGHKGQVKEFLWRAFGTVKDGIDHRDFQLVSWGSDRNLKLHAVSNPTFANVGYEKGFSKPQRLRFTRRGAKYRTFREEPLENDSTVSTLPRADSFPASSQLLRVRGRPSTNMGMSRVPVSHFKGWLQTDRGRRMDMHGRGVGRPETDPLLWIKGVKIHSWDANALADELTQTGERFKKVEFEKIDITQRRATISLQGPWGESSSVPVYMRVDMKFPKGYPRDAQAIFHVQKTNSIAADLQKSLAEDIHKIAQAHRIRGRGCIDAIVQYLLREETPEQIISWTMRDSLTDSKLIEAANLPQDVSDESDDDQIDSITKVMHANANANVPLTKGCAALWAENGKLVCFFRLAGREPTTFLGTLGTGQLDDSDSSKLFGGFGKFQVDSPSRRAKDTTQYTNNGESDSDDSEYASTSTSSTSSSDSSGGLGKRSRFTPWQRTTVESLQRGRSVDGSQRSAALDGMKAESAQTAIVAIYDLSDLLPANKLVAKDYQLKDDILSTCKHNFEVATKHLLFDAAAVWQFAALVVDVPGEQQDQLNQALEDNLDLVPLMTQVRLMVNSDASRSPSDSTPHSWLANLLGRTYIASAVMQFFDKSGDTQMLAMLSAMFLQSQIGTLQDCLRCDPKRVPIAQLLPAASGEELFASQKRPLFGLEARRGPGKGHRQEQWSSISSEIMLDEARMSTSVPVTTMYGRAVNGNHTSSATPSVIAHDPAGFVSALHSTAGSLAGSPESYRLSRRSETSVTFPAATISLSAIPQRQPASPPSHSVRKEESRTTKYSKSLRASPDETFHYNSRSNMRSSLSLANVSGYPVEGQKIRAGRGSSKANLNLHGAEILVRKPCKKKLKTKFYAPATHGDGHHVGSLLQLPSLDTYTLCLSYVQQYITQLEVWQLWVQRAKLVKICAQVTDALDKLTQGKSLSSHKITVDQGLELHHCCTECGISLAPILKNGLAIGWHCISEKCSTNGRTPPKKQRCSICEIVVVGLSVPCLQCDHLACYECAQGWFGEQASERRKRSNSTVFSTARSVCIETDRVSCPTGCGCQCATITGATVAWPDSALGGPVASLASQPNSPRSEGYQESSAGTSVVTERRSRRGESVTNISTGPDSAFNALLALQGQSRHRSTSSTHTASTIMVQGMPRSAAQGMRTRDNSISIVDELLPWASDSNATLGKGSGGGLSRGLNNKGSDATIRKA